MMAEGIAAKIIGAVAGTVLSLVFIPPKSLKEFGRRTAAAGIGGMVAGQVVHDYMKWPDTFDYNVAGAALAAFSAWWAMGLIQKIIAKMSVKE